MRESPGEIMITAFVSRGAAAKQDELDVCAQHFFKRTKFDVHALLFRKPRDRAEQWQVSGLRQTEFFLQRKFVCGFSGQSSERIWTFQKRIGRRIPFVVVHPVKNSKKPVLALSQSVIQAAAEFFRHDFARVTRADCRDNVGKNDSRLETIQLPIKFRAVNRKE